MEGFMILNTITETSYSFGWNNWCFGIIPITLLGFYFLYFYKINCNNHNVTKWGFIGAAMATFSILGMIALCSTMNPVEYEIYQVLLEDTLNIEWFRETYEILDQVGITYMITAK